MIQMIVKYSPLGRDVHNQCSNVFLFNGAPAYNSEAAETTGMNVIAALSRLYPTSTEFMRLLIKQLDANGKPIRGRTASIPVDVNGLFAIGAGDRLAPPNVVATFEKTAKPGRSGLQAFKHCVTSEELDQFTKLGTIPTRFTAGIEINGVANTTFAGQLMQAGANEGLTLVLPDAYGDLVIGPRTVTGMHWAGIRSHSPTRVKTSTLTKQVKAYQQEISDLGRQARRVMQPNDQGEVTFDQKMIRYQLNLKAEGIWDDLTPEQMARVVWPTVFSHNPIPPAP